MTTTRLVFARHGEVDARCRGTIYGRLDVALSPRGVAQSRRMAEVLAGARFDAIVSSGLQRAETAASFARETRDLERIDDERFLELDRGDWASRSIESLQREDPEGYGRWVASRGALRAPGGESPEDVRTRVVPACHEWAQRYPGGQVLIVAHLWVVRSAVAEALGLPMERSGELMLPPGGLCEFDWPAQPGGPLPSLRRFGSGLAAPGLPGSASAALRPGRTF